MEPESTVILTQTWTRPRRLGSGPAGERPDSGCLAVPNIPSPKLALLSASVASRLGPGLASDCEGLCRRFKLKRAVPTLSLIHI
eukprot:2179859-Rhodomonas_salina.2